MRNKKFAYALLFIILFSSFLMSIQNLRPVYASNESALLPMIRFKMAPLASNSTDFYIGYPPFVFNVSQNMDQDFWFNDTQYPGSWNYNGTFYAYEHTYDTKYWASGSARNDAYMGEPAEATGQITSAGGNGGCQVGSVLWNNVVDGADSLPLGTWVSVSQKTLVNLHETNPPGYTTIWNNITTYDYGYVDDPNHKIATLVCGYSKVGGTFSGLLQYNAADYGGYLILEIKNNKWYAPNRGQILLSLTAVLEDIQGGVCNEWVFTNWKYYTFTLTIELPYNDSSIINCAINFTVNVETVGNVNVCFVGNNDTTGFSWQYVSNLSSSVATRLGEPVLLGTGQNTTAGLNIYNVTFPIWFNKQCMDEWLTATTVWAACNATDVSMNATWQVVQPNFFCIYSRGGFSMNYRTTDLSKAYLVSGGTPFSFYAQNGTSVYNEIWYRDLQHIKLLPDVQFKTGLETFELQYGIDYVLAGNSSWQTGWLAQVNPYTVSYTGIFAGNVWINMTGNFKNRNSWLASNSLYMFYHGSVSGTGDIGHWQFWVDLWFSETNASSSGAARINAFEYPMHDNADPWLRWLSSNWGVKDDVSPTAQVEFPLLAADGITPVNAGQIKMIRVWSNLTVDNANSGQQILIKSFDTFDITHAKEFPVEGIPAPVFDETKIPTVGNSGILGAVFSLFSGIGQWLSENVLFGGLNLWGSFVNFLDTIAGMLGAPHFFSNLFSWIGQSVGYVANSVGYVFTVILDIFMLIGSLMVGFLSTIGTLISSMVNTITMFTNIMGGVVGGAGNLWVQLGISNWIIVACVFYPIYLIILWEEKGSDAVISQLTLIFGILTWFFGFFYQLATMLISFVSGLVESIPVVE